MYGLFSERENIATLNVGIRMSIFFALAGVHDVHQQEKYNRQQRKERKKKSKNGRTQRRICKTSLQEME